eukprot:scpid565/ scgid20006/ 
MMAMNGLTGHGMSEEKEYSLATFLMNLDDGDLEYDEDMFKLPADVIPNDIMASENKGLGLSDLCEAETSFQKGDSKAAKMDSENIDTHRYFIINPVFQGCDENVDEATSVTPSERDEKEDMRLATFSNEQI